MICLFLVYLDLPPFLILAQSKHFESVREYLHLHHSLELLAIGEVWSLVHLEEPRLALIVNDHIERHDLEAHLVLVVCGQGEFIVVH